MISFHGYRIQRNSMVSNVGIDSVEILRARAVPFSPKPMKQAGSEDLAEVVVVSDCTGGANIALVCDGFYTQLSGTDVSRAGAKVNREAALPTVIGTVRIDRAMVRGIDARGLTIWLSGKDVGSSALILHFRIGIPLADLFNGQPCRLKITPDVR